MKKNIAKFLIGAIVILMAVFGIGYVSYLSAKDKYFNELKNTIDNKYLEGKQEIGAYDLRINEVTLYEVSCIGDFLGEMLAVQRSCFWEGAGMFDNGHMMSLVNSKKNNYEWINLKLGRFGPFLVIVKKTDRGYDLIGEYITGIGIKYGFPLVLFNSVEEKTGSVSLTPNMASEYVDYLFNQKYKNCLIRTERETKFNHTYYTDEFGSRHDNPKKELLEELVTKRLCKSDESLFFRTNKYFELKYDNYYAEIGSGIFTWEDSTYGNDVQNLFTKTVTLHYSIQENKGILEKEYLNRFSIIALGCIILYAIFIILTNKRMKEVIK